MFRAQSLLVTLGALLVASGSCAAPPAARQKAPTAQLVRQWKTPPRHRSLAQIERHNMIPTRLYRLGREGWLALLPLEPTGLPISNVNLAYFRWKAILALGEEGPWQVQEAGALALAAADYRNTRGSLGKQIHQALERSPYRKPEHEKARAALLAAIQAMDREAAQRPRSG